MTEWRSRIAGVGGNQAAAIAHFHPVSTIPGGMTMPATLTVVTADTVEVHECAPLYADPNAAPIPATARGQWFQLRAAGKP